MTHIVYLGSWDRPWTTESYVAADAERIPGVHVVRVQEPRHARPGFLAELETVASDADLLLYQKTWGLPPETVQLWRRLEQRGCRTASYHLDLYVGLRREAEVGYDPFWKTGVVFTADGDPGTEILLARKGIDHRWLPAAVGSDQTHSGAPLRPRPEVDVAFVGSRSYHPEWPWRRTLLENLAARYGTRFACYPLDGQSRLHGQALNDLYASVPVIVGDSLALPGHRDYFSDRFFETVGRGGYLIGPNVPGIEKFFTSGDHLDLYDLGDLDHVFELIDEALANPADARARAIAGQAHVRAEHTYRHRVEQMLLELDLA